MMLPPASELDWMSMNSLVTTAKAACVAQYTLLCVSNDVFAMNHIDLGKCVNGG